MKSDLKLHVKPAERNIKKLRSGDRDVVVRIDLSLLFCTKRNSFMDGEQPAIQIGQFVLGKNLGIGAFGKVSPRFDTSSWIEGQKVSAKH